VLLLACDPRKRFAISCLLLSSTWPSFGCPALNHIGSERTAMTEKQSPPARHKVALALQGGGSHGAFTWGVLDRLPDDATLDIIGVTGTSAGALNGAVLVDGLVRGGPSLARAKLRRY
jgi:NTE family protein